MSASVGCDNRHMNDELGAFLRSRRAKIRPEDVGFKPGRGRRVQGLRREEVAALASVSVDYISRLEQGRIHPSAPVLDSLARALRLDPGERAHLFALAGRAPAAADVGSLEEVRPVLLRLLAAVEPAPAFVLDARLDLLAWNATASLLFGGFELRPPEERNLARLVFLDPEVRAIVGGGLAGSGLVAWLRISRARGRTDPRLDALVAHLLEGSAAFRELWDEHRVARKTHGRMTFHHPQVGRLDLDWERLNVSGGGGQALMVYSAEPGTPSATALALLGTLAATVAHEG
jgi:transcriptional regulator with XRE-family HTH domain